MSDSTSSNAAGLAGNSLTVRYRKDQEPIINGASIAIPTGRISVFIGPNGSGKSTLLKTLAKQLNPERGSVVLDGKDIATFSARQFACRLGILFQENSAPNDLTVEELVYHGRYPHRKLFESMNAEDRNAVEQALQLACVHELRHNLVNQLSAGQRQLAWIAILLAQQTQYMFLDEPTTFLDLAHQFDVMDLIRRLNKDVGKTIGLVVHDLNLAARYGDHIFAMRNGCIVASGAPAEVLTVETLREVFEVETRLIADEDTGSLYCLPMGKAQLATKEQA